MLLKTLPHIGDVIRCNRCKTTFTVEQCPCEGTRCDGQAFIAQEGANYKSIVADQASEFCPACITEDEVLGMRLHDRAVDRGEALN